MTTQKNTSIGIALLGIFIAISSFENEISAQESERLFPCSDALSEGRVMEIDGAVTNYAIVDKHQVAFYNSNDKLHVCLTERELYGQDRQHDGLRTSDTDAVLMWQKIPDTDLIWSQIDSSSKLNREEAQAWEEAKNADYMDSRLHNAEGLQSIVDDIRSPDTTGTAAMNSKFNPNSILDEVHKNNYIDSDFANNLSFMDTTNFSFVSAKETKQPYHCSCNLYNDGTAYDGMDLPSNGNIFSIDTHANIGGITGKILEMLPWRNWN